MIALALLLALQDGESLVDEPGPPQESLYRAYEAIGTATCLAPDRAAIMREVDLRYRKRIRAVHDAVAIEYGRKVADRGYITVLPCRSYRWDVDLKRGADRAVDAFERELRDWEKRYGLNGQRKALGS